MKFKLIATIYKNNLHKIKIIKFTDKNIKYHILFQN